MKKSILILLLILVISQIKAMDIWNIPNKDEYLDILSIDKSVFEQIDKKPQTEEEKQAEKERQWGMIRKSYLRLAQKAHPDKGGNPVEWAKISNAYDAFKKAYEGLSQPALGPSLQLQEQMKIARMKAANLINQADKIEDPDKARALYEEAIEPFKIGSAIEENTLDYGIDLVSSAYSKIVQKYYQKAQYEKAVEYGKKYYEVLSNISLDIMEIQFAREKISSSMTDYFKQFNLPGYDAELAYTKILEKNFQDLKNDTENAFNEIKKIFEPIWTQTKQDLKSNNIEKIKNDLNKIENYLKYEFEIFHEQLFDDFNQRIEYVRGYLKLADAYIKAGKLIEAQKVVQNELENVRNQNVFLFERSLKSEFENKLNQIKQQKIAISIDPQSEKNLLEAFKQLIHNFSVLQSNLLKG